jgi:hypothetical protein
MAGVPATVRLAFRANYGRKATRPNNNNPPSVRCTGGGLPGGGDVRPLSLLGLDTSLSHVHVRDHSRPLAKERYSA